MPPRRQEGRRTRLTHQAAPGHFYIDLAPSWVLHSKSLLSLTFLFKKQQSAHGFQGPLLPAVSLWAGGRIGKSSGRRWPRAWPWEVAGAPTPTRSRVPLAKSLHRSELVFVLCPLLLPGTRGCFHLPQPHLQPAVKAPSCCLKTSQVAPVQFRPNPSLPPPCPALALSSSHSGTRRLFLKNSDQVFGLLGVEPLVGILMLLVWNPHLSP